MGIGRPSATPPSSSLTNVLSPSTLQVTWFWVSRARRKFTNITSPWNGTQLSESLRGWPLSFPSVPGLGRPTRSLGLCCLVRCWLQISLPPLLLPILCTSSVAPSSRGAPPRHHGVVHPHALPWGSTPSVAHPP